MQGICLHHRKNVSVFICITNLSFREFVKILEWYIGNSLIDMESKRQEAVVLPLTSYYVTKIQ